MQRFTVFIFAVALAACGSSGPKKAEPPPPMVSAATVVAQRFVDRIEAVGTARANEQVTLSAPVTQRITRINFRDGGYVAKGQVIAELARGQETAQLAAAQAQSRGAAQQLRRLQELRQRGFATNASLDAQIAAADAARAQAAQASAEIGDRVIRAPFSGFASLRMVSPGAVVNAGTEIAQISDISRIKLDFPVPETMLSSIRVGQAITARSAAFPDKPFRGTIAVIDPVIDPNTRAVLVRAMLPNPSNMLKPGMLLSVAIEAQPRTSLAVPELAVVGEGEEKFVFLIGADSRVKRIRVETGVRSDGMIEILNGLKPGQRVVGEGIVKVSDGITIRLEGERGTQPPGNRAPVKAAAS